MEDEIDELIELKRIIAQMDYQPFIKLSKDANGLRVDVTNTSELEYFEFFDVISYVRKFIKPDGYISIIDPIDYTDNEISFIPNLSYCIFKENVSFKACTFNYKINLSNSIFEKGINFN